MKQLPRSPFTTPLSGSAREAELRIRSIFQWKKQRPPLWAMILTAALILTCGGLVSCHLRQQGPSIEMDVQFYDTSENYIEIPVLVMPDGAETTQGITAINAALAELKGEYSSLLSAPESNSALCVSNPVFFENRCLLYPTETNRYLSLLFFRDEFKTDLSTAHLTSFVYDKENCMQITLDDALVLAGKTEAGLCQSLADQFDPTLGQDIPGSDLCIQNQTLEAFRMKADGQPIFYLTARSDDRDDLNSDFISGADHIYIWDDGSFTLYNQYTPKLEPLVPTEECLSLQPPLYCQWYFDG